MSTEVDDPNRRPSSSSTKESAAGRGRKEEAKQNEANRKSIVCTPRSAQQYSGENELQSFEPSHGREDYVGAGRQGSPAVRAEAEQKGNPDFNCGSVYALGVPGCHNALPVLRLLLEPEPHCENSLRETDQWLW